MIGVRHVKLDPRNPRIVYATAWNNAIHRSAPSLEGRRRLVQAGLRDRRAAGGSRISRCSTSRCSDGHTRIYVYNGTRGDRDAGAVPARQRGRAGVEAGHRQRRQRSRTPRAWIAAHVERPGAAGLDQPAHLLVASASTISSSRCPRAARHRGHRRRRDADVRRADDPIDERRRELLRVLERRAERRGTRSHVDVRAVVFHPQNPDIAFVGSDGGVVRNDGTFTNISSRCQQLFDNAPQCPTMLVVGADAAVLPEPRTADAAVLQRRARSARAAAAA